MLHVVQAHRSQLPNQVRLSGPSRWRMYFDRAVGVAFVTPMALRGGSSPGVLPTSSRGISASPRGARGGVRAAQGPLRWGGTGRAVRASAGRPAAARASTALLLAAVPALWGSYGVAGKLLLAHAGAVPAPLLNSAAYAVSLVALAGARALTAPGAARPQARKRAADTAVTYRAAAELGAYLFLGSLAQLVALESTAASRAAFLVQLTTILVPVLDVAVLGAPARARTFAAAGAALLGVVILGGVGAAGAAINVGDALSVVAALFYTVHVLRLQVVLPRVPSVLKLVEAKAVVQLILGLGAALLSLRAGGTTALMGAVAHATTADVIIGALCITWIGAMTSAAATVAQVEGQRRVGPSLAAVVYASQPVFAVVFAVLFLQDQLTMREAIGGALVVLSGFAVAL